MKYIRAFLFFICPSILLRLLYGGKGKFVVKKNAKVGFSFILSDGLVLEENSRIGHLNFIKCKSLQIGRKGAIRHLNFIKGNFRIDIGEQAWIRNQNKISSHPDTYHCVQLILEREAKIGVRHLLDLTDSVTIGEFSMLAGVDSQIWTHSPDFIIFFAPSCSAY